MRVGNAAHSQAQHDVWGAVLDSVYLHTKSRDHAARARVADPVHAGRGGAGNWREPDRGIWEVRGEPQHFTSSKLMCWVALDRGARLAELREDWELAARWRAAADEIHADICANALDSRGVFTQHYDTNALDASILLMPLVRFLPPEDERVRATVLAIADELTEDGLVLRYRVEETDDGLAGEEGDVHDLLVLARLGADARSGSSSARGTCASGCCRYRARSASTRRRSTPARAATSATSRRPSPTSR